MLRYSDAIEYLLHKGAGVRETCMKWWTPPPVVTSQPSTHLRKHKAAYSKETHASITPQAGACPLRQRQEVQETCSCLVPRLKLSAASDPSFELSWLKTRYAVIDKGVLITWAT